MVVERGFLKGEVHPGKPNLAMQNVYSWLSWTCKEKIKRLSLVWRAAQAPVPVQLYSFPPQQHQGICHSVVPIKLFLLKLCPFPLLFYGNVFSNYLVSFSVNIMWSSTNTATHCHLIPGYSFSERSFLCRNFLDLGCEKAKWGMGSEQRN